MKKIYYFFHLLLLPIALLSSAQTQSFENEVLALVDKYQNNPVEEGGIVFTGSSTIRLWLSLKKDFPKSQIVNTGFGGSQTHHLLEFADELIVSFAPSKVFIYEGDNDINAGKSTAQILEDFELLISKLRSGLAGTQYYILSAKPSPSRWGLNREYQELNEALEIFSNNQPDIYFINIWSPLLQKSGNPNPKLFIEDNLHLNERGYKILKKAIRPYLK
jgi:lysophospholipase L1-like esterase